MKAKPTLLFVSTRFLFPNDSGGKIRTTQVLRGLKGGAFKIRLLMPGSDQLAERHRDEVASVCDEFRHWEVRERSRAGRLLAASAFLFSDIPIPVLMDRHSHAQALVKEELDREPDLVVFDFPHSAILAPQAVSCRSVMFTHNVEAEIFKRHHEVAKSPWTRWLWRNQARKMSSFEGATLRSFDNVIAVSERDCAMFQREYGVEHCGHIPTGVDTDFFHYSDPLSNDQVVFCGSMDWMANIDAIEYFHDQIWPLVARRAPHARMKVIGRNPPDALVHRITSASPNWEFTGFVDDVREHVSGAAAFVIPLRVGGGTRIKAFEAMAMGCPVVSTSIGVEGLAIEDGVHYSCADDEQSFADAVVALLDSGEHRAGISTSARSLVEREYGFRKAATVFENLCRATLVAR